MKKKTCEAELANDEEKKNKKIRRRDSRNILKKTASITASFVALGAIAGIVGCDSNSNNGIENSNNGIENGDIKNDINGDQNKDENVVDDDDEKTPPVDDITYAYNIDDFIDALDADNYTLVAEDDTSRITYYFAGDRYQRQVQDGLNQYFKVDGDNTYKLTWNSSDQRWHMEYSDDLYSAKDIIYNDLASAIWDETANDTGVFSGTVSGEDATLDIADWKENGAEFETASKSINITDIGSTTISYPRSSIIVDDTNKTNDNEENQNTDEENQDTDEENQDNNNEDENNNQDSDEDDNEVFVTNNNGTYDFDIEVMAKTIGNWLKGDNKWGEDYFEVRSGRVGLNQLLFIDTSDVKNIKLGELLNNDDDSALFSIDQFNDVFYTTLLEGKSFATVGELREFLESFAVWSTNFGSYDSLDYEYSTFDCTSDQQNEFETLTKNVFNTLSTKGQREHRGDEYTDKREEFADAEVLIGFKGEYLSSYGTNMGIVVPWYQSYIVKTSNGIEYVKLHILSSASGGERNYRENVLKGKDDWYLITVRDEILLDDNNRALFDNLVTTASTATSIVAYYDDKQRKL